MTVALTGQDINKLIAAKFPQAVVEFSDLAVVVKADQLLKVVGYLKDTPELDYNYLTDITSADYFDYFEVIYRLTSLSHNTTLVLKVRCYDREKPAVPSLTSFYQGANFMEREIYDLMGILFPGHPNMKRIVLWEGFVGHPLRKDYL